MPGLDSAAGKYRDLCTRLGELPPVAVAFSGGVDSSLLMAAALAVQGEQVLVLHARSPLQAAGECEKALTLAADLQCRPEIVDLDPYAWPEFVANPRDRCYHCKKRIYARFLDRAREQGRAVLLDGTNADDLKTDRPGLRALEEMDVHTPLAQVGLSKKEVRSLACKQGLPNWDKPSASCLATRIMTGQAITPERIAVVAAGEKFLAGLGFSGCRFRHFGHKCLLEVEPDDYNRLTSRDIRLAAESFCRCLGFTAVDLGMRP